MRPRLVPVVCAFVAGMLVASGAAYGANPFTDIAGTGGHMNNIDAIYNAGITLGCGNPADNKYCPNDPVTRAQMASFIARLGGLTSGSTKNFPKVNAKGPTQAYCALATANVGSYPSGPCTPSIATVDASENAGRYSAASIGADGLPIVVYATRLSVDLGGGDILKFAHCGNAACTSGNVVTTIDPNTSSGFFPSIAVGSDGLPIISYTLLGLEDLKVIHCGNALCNLNNTTISLDTVGAVGRQSSIAVGVDGLPVISYYDMTNGNLKLAHCVDVVCTAAGSAITTVDNSANDVGQWTAVEIGSDGFPLIGYYDATNKSLKAAHCANSACIGGTTITTLDDTAGDVGSYLSLAIGTDGLPIMSYADRVGEQGDLRIAHCSNVLCTASTFVDPVWGELAGVYGSIAIGSDGLPIVSSLFAGTGQLDLQVARCTSLTCASTPRITRLDETASSGFYSSVAIGVDGVPVVAYQAIDINDLKVARIPAA